MDKHAFILSNNAPLFEFMSRKLKEACNMQASNFPTMPENHTGPMLIMVDHQVLAHSGDGRLLHELRAKYPHGVVIVFGEEDDHINQHHVLTGAKDFLNARMMTSPAFVRYLKLKFERDWQLAD